MLWRASLIMIAAMALSAPAAAELLSDQERFGFAPSWRGSPRQYRGYDDRGGDRYRGDQFDYYGDDDDDGYDRGRAQKSDEAASGGERPAIQPEEPPLVSFVNDYGPGTIVIDTEGRELYYVLSPDQAYRYPIAVGREGFGWSGAETVSRIQPWPDWYPPEDMRERDPRLPIRMTGGINNPLGAIALYLGTTLYRIHGTNDAKSIGHAASSGCFRMLNKHALHLAGLAHEGTKVVVVKSLPEDQTSGIAEAGRLPAAGR